MIALAFFAAGTVGIWASLKRLRFPIWRTVAAALAADAVLFTAFATDHCSKWLALAYAGCWNFWVARDILNVRWLPDVGGAVTWGMRIQRRRDLDRLKTDHYPDGFYAWAVEREPGRPIMLAECGIDGTIEGRLPPDFIIVDDLPDPDDPSEWRYVDIPGVTAYYAADGIRWATQPPDVPDWELRTSVKPLIVSRWHYDQLPETLRRFFTPVDWPGDDPS